MSSLVLVSGSRPKVRYKLAIHNGGPAAMVNIRVRVETEDNNSTVRIGPDDGTGST